MNEISIFYDKESKNPIGETISFEPLMAGEKTEKTLFVHNNLDWVADVELAVEGNDVKIEKNISTLNPKSSDSIILSFEPKLTTMKPINARINIKGKYIIT